MGCFLQTHTVEGDLKLATLRNSCTEDDDMMTLAVPEEEHSRRGGRSPYDTEMQVCFLLGRLI